jgi:adenylate cyclase
MTPDGTGQGSGLLDGLEGSARQQRAELIGWLLERGFDVEQIRHTLIPALLPARRVLGDDGTYVSARDIGEANDVDLELLQRMQRAIGLPRWDDPDAPVHLMADGLARVVEVMRSAALASIIQPGATELQIAQGSEALVSRLAPLLGPTMQDILFLQLRHSMETAQVTQSELAAGTATAGAREVTVAFGDLVGFTRLGEAVMLVSPEPARLGEAVLDLVRGVDDHDLPQLRVGAASGWAVSRAGDWFGSPVNVASRVTSVARPGSVVVAESTRSAIGDDGRFVWSFAGARHLKGIDGETKLFRARRSAEN